MRRRPFQFPLLIYRTENREDYSYTLLISSSTGKKVMNELAEIEEEGEGRSSAHWIGDIYRLSQFKKLLTSE